MPDHDEFETAEDGFVRALAIGCLAGAAAWALILIAIIAFWR